MNALLSLLARFWALLIWWYVIAPWEKALRVRGGSRVIEVGPGIHFRVPYLDVVYRQSTRLHFTSLDPQTVTTQDGSTITFAGVFGYVVTDLRKLYDSIQSPEATLQSLVQGALAQYISTHPTKECEPDTVEQAVMNDIDVTEYGLGDARLSLTTYARVKTYRLIMDQHAIYSTGLGVNNPESAAHSTSTVVVS